LDQNQPIDLLPPTQYNSVFVNQDKPTTSQSTIVVTSNTGNRSKGKDFQNLLSKVNKNTASQSAPVSASNTSPTTTNKSIGKDIQKPRYAVEDIVQDEEGATSFDFLQLFKDQLNIEPTRRLPLENELSQELIDSTTPVPTLQEVEDENDSDFVIREQDNHPQSINSFASQFRKLPLQLTEVESADLQGELLFELKDKNNEEEKKQSSRLSNKFDFDLLDIVQDPNPVAIEVPSKNGKPYSIEQEETKLKDLIQEYLDPNPVCLEIPPTKEPTYPTDKELKQASRDLIFEYLDPDPICLEIPPDSDNPYKDSNYTEIEEKQISPSKEAPYPTDKELKQASRDLIFEYLDPDPICLEIPPDSDNPYKDSNYTEIEGKAQPQEQPQEQPQDQPAEYIGTDTSTSMSQPSRPPIATATAFLPRSAAPFVTSLRNPKNERSCFGHKETVFGLSFSPCGRYLATAGQESIVNVWDVEKNKLICTLRGHNIEYECLRVAWASENWGSNILPPKNGPNLILASAGANGIVKIWQPDMKKRINKSCLMTMDHGDPDFKCSSQYDEGKKQTKPLSEEEESKVPQVYALQFIEKWSGAGAHHHDDLSLLITSSDDCIHLWELVLKETSQKNACVEIGKDNQALNRPELRMEKRLVFRFADINMGYGGVFAQYISHQSDNIDPISLVSKRGKSGGTPALTAINEDEEGNNTSTPSKNVYGGPRNPDNLIFVFDASFCHGNSLLAVALSDGTCRLVNARGICVAILELPGSTSHLTAVAWDSKGERLTTCVGTGHLILWGIDMADEKAYDDIIPSCVAVLDGGHDPNRPLFGALYCGGNNEDLIMSWGVDGKLCLWDSHSRGEVHKPLDVLLTKKNYPFYGVEVKEYTNVPESPIARIAVVGGTDGGFIGVPVYLYDISN